MIPIILVLNIRRIVVDKWGKLCAGNEEEEGI